MERKLLKKIDCLQEASPADYFSYGETKIVEGAAGRYREAEGKPLSRFGYRFRIQNPDKPHMAVIRYPDDKPRFMIINDGTSYDLSTGIQTGVYWPESGEMKEVRNIFWPRWTDCSIVLMSWGFNHPAAAASIEIFELAELPAAELPAQASLTGYRKIGIKYEDPCGTQAAEGATNFKQWLDHLTTYMKHTGQQSLTYPICWYHGPCMSMDCEPSSNCGMTVAKDRKQYIVWDDEPDDWPAKLLERFDEEKLEFRGMLTLLRLGSLLSKMNIDQYAIEGGAETFNNMLWNNKVQSGTGEWTIVYNSRNVKGIIEGGSTTPGNPKFNYAYGERHGLGIGHAGPMFNPLHPTVQAALLNFIGELGSKYAKYKSFRGVNISMWPATLIWFGSIRSGYDDYTIQLFQEETGIKVPIELDDPQRFAKRYEYLTFQVRMAWIKWRCMKVRELILKLRDRLVAERSDLELSIDSWVETFVPILYGVGGVEHQIGARAGTLNMFIEGGFDPSLYAGEDNLRITYQIEGGGRDGGFINNEDYTEESHHMFRDHDYLDQKTLDAFAATDRPGGFIFNDWHEAWGEHKWRKLTQDEMEQAREYAYLYGKPSEICGANSKYPEDGFWWDSQLRICHAFPGPEHFLEHYVHALAELDAMEITRGGLFLDKAHSDQLRQFACEYQKLPEKKFDTVGDSTDPVAVRQTLHEGKRILYAVNRSYFPVEICITFANEKTKNIALSGYGLKVLEIEAEQEAVTFKVNVDEKISSGILTCSDDVVKSIERVQQTGQTILGADEFVIRMKDAIKKRKLAWLTRANKSYIAAKASRK